MSTIGARRAEGGVGAPLMTPLPRTAGLNATGLPDADRQSMETQVLASKVFRCALRFLLRSAAQYRQR